MYPPPSHTVHPPHQIATILEESVILAYNMHFASAVHVMHVHVFIVLICTTHDYYSHATGMFGACIMYM